MVNGDRRPRRSGPRRDRRRERVEHPISRCRPAGFLRVWQGSHAVGGGRPPARAPGGGARGSLAALLHTLRSPSSHRVPKHGGFQGLETGIRMPAYPLSQCEELLRDYNRTSIREWALSARLVRLLPARTLRIRLDPMATFLAPHAITARCSRPSCAGSWLSRLAAQGLG